MVHRNFFVVYNLPIFLVVQLWLIIHYRLHKYVSKMVVMYLAPTDKMNGLKKQFKHFFHEARES